MIDHSTLPAALEAIRKRFGHAIVTAGNEMPQIPRISTGSLELDFATGGGIPIGRWSRFYGTPSSTKSMTAYNVVANAQRDHGMNCFIYDAENQVDPARLAALGIDLAPEACHIIRTNVAEEIAEIMESTFSSVDLHIIDSASSCTCLDALAGNVEDWTRGLMARVWTKVIPRAMKFFNSERNVVIVVDQLRDTFASGPRGGGPPHPPGGQMLAFTSSMSLRFLQGKALFYDKNGVLDEDMVKTNMALAGTVDADGGEVQIKVDKSRVSRPHRQARLRIDFETMRFDQLHEMVKAAVYFGVVSGGPTWWTLADGSKIQGSYKLRKAIEADPFMQQAIRDRVKEEW